MRHYSNEEIFCVKYLKDRGILSEKNLSEIESLLDGYTVDFRFVRVRKSFFHDLAEGLRAIWPPGEKDGKYPWRESVINLERRLQTLWAIRGLKEYPLDLCLACGRKYVAQFQDSTKYMKTLKYFILKQGEIIQKNGKVEHIDESTFADMLESDELETIKAEYSNAFESSTTLFDEGLLI